MKKYGLLLLAVLGCENDQEYIERVMQVQDRARSLGSIYGLTDTFCGSVGPTGKYDCYGKTSSGLIVSFWCDGEG